MKNRTIFLAIATVLLLLAGGIGINRLCQKTAPEEQPPRQKQLYPPFVYKPDSATRARWEKLNPSEQKELEFRKFEDYMSDFDSRKFTLDEPNIVLEPNPMAKLKGYEEYKAYEDYKYPFDYIWYPGMHIHGMTKEQVLEKYKDNRMVSYGEADTFRYGIHIEHKLYFPFIAFMYQTCIMQKSVVVFGILDGKDTQSRELSTSLEMAMCNEHALDMKLIYQNIR